jgi:hypothetical protein
MGCSQSDSDSGLGSIVTPARFARRDALFVLAAAATSFLDLVSSFVFVPVDTEDACLDVDVDGDKVVEASNEVEEDMGARRTQPE